MTVPHIQGMEWKDSMKPAERRSYANANIKRAMHSEQVSHWVKVQDRIRRAVQARIRRAKQNEGKE